MNIIIHGQRIPKPLRIIEISILVIALLSGLLLLLFHGWHQQLVFLIGCMSVCVFDLAFILSGRVGPMLLNVPIKVLFVLVFLFVGIIFLVDFLYLYSCSQVNPSNISGCSFE